MTGRRDEPDVTLREVQADDIPVFFEQQLDAEANWMAAFTPKDPSDREAFDARWARILADDTIRPYTVMLGDQVAGSVLIWVDEEMGGPEVSYWFGREYWGQGVATEALTQFLERVAQRPLYARVAKDNTRSQRVLEKCGFVIIGEDRGHANARDAETEEYVLTLAG